MKLNKTSEGKPVAAFRLDPMTYTCFEEGQREFMASQGVLYVGRPQDADVAITRYYGNVTSLRRLRLGRRSRRRLQFLIWTDEPRHNTLTANRVKGRAFVPDLHVMNCFTGDIYFNNYYHCRWAMRERAKELDRSGPLLKDRKMVILTHFVSDRSAVSLNINGKEADLSWLRCRIAIEGHKAGLVDIYGKRWPAGKSIEESREAAWEQRKMSILGNYRFNLCLENTIYPNYCTEKIWHSIAAGCLPVYYGSGTNIYADFPQQSFLDYSEVGGPGALFEKILSMSEEEYRHRMNLCIHTYNRIFDSGCAKVTWERVVKNAVEKLRMLAIHA